eukprot:5099449-Alexandrium_andersonii.AAC.1
MPLGHCLQQLDVDKSPHQQAQPGHMGWFEHIAIATAFGHVAPEQLHALPFIWCCCPFRTASTVASSVPERSPE